MLKQKTPLRQKTPLKAYKKLEQKTPLKRGVTNLKRTKLKTKQKTARKLKTPYHSIFTDNLYICYITGYPGAEPHHVFNASNKSLSEKYGFILPLRSDWHTSTSYSIHNDYELSLKYKKICEEYYLEHYGTVEEFIQEFGCNYLEQPI